MADNASPQLSFRLDGLRATSDVIDVPEPGVRLVEQDMRRLSCYWDDADDHDHAVSHRAAPNLERIPSGYQRGTGGSDWFITEADGSIVTIPRLCPTWRHQETGQDVEPETAHRWN